MGSVVGMSDGAILGNNVLTCSQILAKQSCLVIEHLPEESWILSNNIHNIGSNDCLVIFASFDFTQPK